jgi:hypothetical protein
MLEFIVLGQIPGTNLQITIAWFVLIIFALIVWADIKFHRPNPDGSPKNNKKLTT